MNDTTAVLPTPDMDAGTGEGVGEGTGPLPAAGALTTVTPVILARFPPLAFSAVTNAAALAGLTVAARVVAAAVATDAEATFTRNLTETDARRENETITISVLEHAALPPAPQTVSPAATTSLKAVCSVVPNCAAVIPASEIVAST